MSEITFKEAKELTIKRWALVTKRLNNIFGRIPCGLCTRYHSGCSECEGFQICKTLYEKFVKAINEAWGLSKTLLELAHELEEGKVIEIE